jgi:biopolymer transport protein ExbB/TolQ
MQANSVTTPTVWAAFQEGGWMMWFIFVFGLLALTAAGRFAWRGEHQMLAFIRAMGATVFSSGLFGFVIGMQKVLRYVVERAPASERLAILLIGIREALSTVAAALLFLVLIHLATAVGHRRHPLPNPSAVPR